MKRIAWAISLFLCACSSDPGLDTSFEAAGPHPVGNTTISVTDAARGRTLSVEIWYPADESARAAAEAGHPVAEFVADGAERDQYSGLLGSAPAGCPSTSTGSARDGAVATTEPEGWPLLVFSHCHNCTRFSSFAIAERLASHGFVVAAPDHEGNTLFDDLAGTGVDLGEEFLLVRAADISFVLDTMLDGQASAVPDGLRGNLDADRVGVYGHSFGAVTTGLVVQNDPRPRAGFALASPMENPLLPGVEMTEIDKPLGFLVAVEDNSITEIGNLFIRNNFDDAVVPVWKGEVIDAGHWTFSDIAGLAEQFNPGCGEDVRQTDGSMFSYLPVADGVAIAQAYVTAFFAAHVLGDQGAQAYLQQARPAAWLTVDWRE